MEILELLKNFDLMDEKSFGQEVRSLVDRKEEIMKGKISLKEILDESSNILKKSSESEREISRIKLMRITQKMNLNAQQEIHIHKH